MSIGTWIMILFYVFVIGGSAVFTMIHTMKSEESNKQND